MSTPKAKRASQPKVVKPRIVPDDLPATVTEALRQVRCATAANLKKALPKSSQAFHKEALEVARALAHRGELHRWTKGTTEIFFADEPFAMLERVLLGQLAGKTLSKTQLKALAKAAHPGLESLLDEWLLQAAKRGILFGAPKGPFATEPDVRTPLKAVFAALKKALATDKLKGVPKQRVASELLAELGLTFPAESHPAGRADFLAALQQLIRESPQQALHSARELRAHLTLSKEQFDELALELSREGAISLHHHDHANALPEAERSELIRDARGNHYIAIGLRRG